MRADLLQLASDLSRRGEPFVLATVVRREPPSSARTGNTALVTRGGAFHGWLGGSCTQPTVVREAQAALRDGTPRLLGLQPDPTAETRPGVIALPMTCHSGGSVDVYIEPVLPAPRLLVFGVAPAAQAMVRIAKVLGYTVEAIDREADVATFPEADHIVTDPDAPDLAHRAKRDPARLYAVVATLGVDDEAPLQRALALSPAYVGLIASRKRFAQLRPLLVARDVPPEAVAAISCPAGLDIGAVAPEEIALSVLAEIVEAARAEAAKTETAPGAHAGTIDPVCGMTVDPATARYRIEHAGRTFYFCCGGCRERFQAAPETFAAAANPDTGRDA